MKSRLWAVAIIYLLVLAPLSGAFTVAADLSLPAGWHRVDTATTYDIYAQNVVYGDTPFLITDMREGDKYANKESYEMRSVTVYRAQTNGQFLDDQPVVFFVHGGGWTDEYAEWYDFVADSFTGEKGWVTVVVDYRLTSDQVFLADQYCPDRVVCGYPENVAARTKAAWYPDNIQDVADAFQWAVDHIGDYGGNPNQIVIFGHSAGGHLVSLLATHSDYEETLRPAIRAVVSMSGAYSLKELDMLTFGGVIDQTFTGGHVDNDAQLDEASPANYVKPGVTLPPFYLLHCAVELPSLPAEKIMFQNKLGMFGQPVYDDYLPNYTHVTEMKVIGDVTETPTALIVDFIEKILRLPPYDKIIYLPFAVK